MRFMIPMALMLNLRIKQAYTLHLRLCKAAKDPEAFKDP